MLTGAALALVDVLLAGRAGKPARAAADVRPGRHRPLAGAVPGLQAAALILAWLAQALVDIRADGLLSTAGPAGGAGPG